jgi:sulfur carrier protein ThiS
MQFPLLEKPEEHKFCHMSAILRPYGILKSYIDDKPEISVEAGRTILQVLQILGMPPDVVALVLVNDEVQPKDYVLRDGDTVKLMAIIGGGTRRLVN